MSLEAEQQIEHFKSYLLALPVEQRQAAIDQEVANALQQIAANEAKIQQATHRLGDVRAQLKELE